MNCEALELKPKKQPLQASGGRFAASGCRAPLHYKQTTFVTNETIGPTGLFHRLVVLRSVEVPDSSAPPIGRAGMQKHLEIYF